uniref:Putative methyltransferase n=1 Tax=viral metagenome TaxID=1070528 RepID=A0A6M3KH07_9ZZZZ
MKLDYIVTTITNDSVKSRTIECLELARWILFKDNIGFYWNVMYGDGKARSRSIACSKFLDDTDADYQVFIDGDILFTPDNLRRLFEDLRSGYDLIAGLFAVRGGTQPSSYGYNAVYNLDGKIHEFEYLSTGFWGTTRKCLERMRKELPLPLLHPNDLKFHAFFEEKQQPLREAEPIFLSEDYDFCEKARKLGIKSYIDTSIQLGHIGEYVYTLQNVVDHQKEIGAQKEAEAKKKTEAEAKKKRRRTSTAAAKRL